MEKFLPKEDDTNKYTFK